MVPLFATVFLIIYGIESLVGTAANTFIAVINLADWTKGITLTPIDQIVLFLGLSNLCLQGTGVTAGFAFFFCSQLFNVGFSSQVFCFFLLCSTFSSFWLTALLFASYSLKILNWSQWPFFLWMKVKMFKHMLWLILWTLVLAFGFSVIAASRSSTDAPPGTANHTGNYSKPPLIFHRSIYLRLFFFTLESTWPVCITCLGVIHLLKDIWKHIWHLKTTMTGSEEPNLNAHKGATKTLISLFICYVFYYLSWSAILLDLLSYSSIEFLICMTMLSILSSAQAVTIILGKPKLKKKALGIFQKFKLSTAEEHDQAKGDISRVTSL